MYTITCTDYVIIYTKCIYMYMYIYNDCCTVLFIISLCLSFFLSLSPTPYFYPSLSSLPACLSPFLSFLPAGLFPSLSSPLFYLSLSLPCRSLPFSLFPLLSLSLSLFPFLSPSLSLFPFLLLCL